MQRHWEPSRAQICAREHACPLLYTTRGTVPSLKQTETLRAGFCAVGLVEGGS